MNQGESRSVITFPENGVRAVDVPLKKMEVRLDDGIIDFPNDENEDPIVLEDELDQSMQFMRSLVMALDVDATLENIYSNDHPVQADAHHFEDLPDKIERFKIDPTLDKEHIYPEKFQLFLGMYNTRNLPALSNLKSRGSIDHTETIDSTSWTTVISRPGFSFDKEKVVYENTGSNDVIYRIQTIDAGLVNTVELNNAGEKKLTLSSGESDDFYIDTASEFIRLQAKESISGNPSEVTAALTGE
jgi:hypothetical protein